jgi:hypothetical protein
MLHIDGGRVTSSQRAVAARAVSVVLLVAAMWAIACVTAAGAEAAATSATKVVRYGGLRLTVPAAWPVYDLSRQGTTCVRFNRHAVYLGAPGAAQRCPSHSFGRTEAILIEPLSHAARAAADGPALPAPPAGAGGVATEIVRHGLAIFATWNARPDIVRRALGVRTLHVVAFRPAPHLAADIRARSSGGPGAHAAAIPGAVFTGIGFDACSAPSSSQMAAWAASPYRAIGVYIGGANMACSQTNLTATWASQQAANGWHLIPIYVGLQAPKNSCGCAYITPNQAASEGAAAAADAVTQAQALGLGPGNPIYDDMEGYSHTSANTSAVLAFLNAWTVQLHASGYKSGVYSSDASGITDLVSQYAVTTFNEPDDLWSATWDGQQNTNDPYVPTTEWVNHQRLNQYSGGQNATYGGVTINIDGDYVDATTAAAGSSAPPPPTLAITPASDGSIAVYPSWTSGPPVTTWQLLGGASPSAVAVTATAAASSPRLVVDSTFPYFAVQALDGNGNVLGTSAPVPTPPHLSMYGHTMFAPAGGLGAVPVGCYNSAPCHIAATISIGRTILVRTGHEYVPTGGGLVYFSLPSSARRRLTAAHGRLLVRLTLNEASGLNATRLMTIAAFSTSGASPSRSSQPAPTLRVAGLTAFVSNGWVGGVLSACADLTPCSVRTTITAGRTVIATTRSAPLGVAEFGYLLFTLTRAGHSLLAHAHGNQLPVTVTLDDGTATASARIVLVSF